MEMELKTSSENYEILKSGSVITFGKNSSINFEINFKEIKFNFNMRLDFIDTEDKKVSINKRVRRRKSNYYRM